MADIRDNDSWEPGKYRGGVYPHADEANVFGELYLQFAADYRASNQVDEDVRGQYCLPSYESLLWWSWARIKEDDLFLEFYKMYADGVALTPSMMARVLGEARAALARQDLWGYPKLPEWGLG